MGFQHDNYIPGLPEGKPKPCGRTGEMKQGQHPADPPRQRCNDSLPDPRAGSMHGRSVIRAPKDLHVHPALRELDCWDLANSLNEAERARHHVATPILITSERMVLAGFGRWRSALLHGEAEIECIEYALGQESSLKFILSHHKPERGWNRFIRTRLALTLEPSFERDALENMRDGGRYKGSAKLPNAKRIDVRHKIAEIAGVGDRTVSNVKTILTDAHPRLITALADSSLTINIAVGLCKLPRPDQLVVFTQLAEERGVDKVIRRTLARSRKKQPCLDTSSLLAALQLYESRHPGSVVVRRGPRCTTISVANQLLDEISLRRELPVHETPRSTQTDTASDPSLLGTG